VKPKGIGVADELAAAGWINMPPGGVRPWD
jgi:hypothetical protein